MKKGRLKDSFRYAFEGIAETVKSERNMKIHFAAMLIVLFFGAVFKISKTEWLICIILFSLVIAGELFNTAIEAVVDMVMPKEHMLAKKAKDAAAGGVLILAIGAAVIGLIIFVPKILSAIV